MYIVYIRYIVQLLMFYLISQNSNDRRWIICDEQRLFRKTWNI